jgi:3-hydroxyacyl-[acyl-carrier-protein] dehydratase
MLKNDFYTCEEVVVSDQELKCRLVFNEDHAIFKGHFPGNPVVPGVCMMEIVKELLQEQVMQSLVLRTSGNVKFLQIISPLLQPTIAISWKDKDGLLGVKAAITLDNAAMFKFDGAYGVLA